MKHRNTGTLIRKLKEAKIFESFCVENAEELTETDFCAYLEKLCREKHTEAGKVIKASDIDRTYGYQIFNGTRKPSRDKVIQLAFGLGLDVEETQSLLRAADKSILYPRIKRDAAIIFAVSKKMRLTETQIFLMSLGMSIIGE